MITVIIFSTLMGGLYLIITYGGCSDFFIKYGSIVGAIIGLFGVQITLDFNQKQNNKNKMIEFKPFLNFNYNYNINPNGYIIFFLNQNNKQFENTLEIKNDGLGEARIISITSDYFQCIDEEQYIIINKDKSYNLLFGIKNLDSMKPSQKVEVIIKYADFLKNEYCGTFSFEFIEKKGEQAHFMFSKIVKQEPISNKGILKWFKS